MVPKVGETVRFSNDFIDKFIKLNNNSYIYQDWKKYFLDNQGKDIEITDVSISQNFGFSIEYAINNNKGSIEINNEGVLFEWINDIDIPIFTYDRISEKAISHLYCSCSSPQIKKVFISAFIQYDFCENCKKEVR